MMPVLLSTSTDAAWRVRLDDATARALGAGPHIAASLALAAELGRTAPLPGSGRTPQLWELLASLGAADLTVARVVEPHADALAILAEAGEPQPAGTWGVFAAEGPGMRVTASETSSGWVLDGTKPWCSLAAHLDHALVTAHAGDERRLFAIDLRSTGVTVNSGGWVARGLAGVTSESIVLAAVDAHPVGAAGWYLSRAGFAWGGAGVAAIWFGASVALGRSLFESARTREPDQLGLFLLGQVDRELSACRDVLASAAREIDAGSAHPAIVAQRVRSTASATAENVLRAVGHALGPAPLARDETHARRVADLELYVRQDHAERDLARLGSKLLEEGEPPW